MPGRGDMKQKVARTVKWTAIDRGANVVVNVVTGIILANVLPREDFGLIGALLVFQAFATLFVDAGFSTALIQKKRCSRADYSSVMWFNLAAATVIYLILYIGAPLIAQIFDNDVRLIPLGRVMFLTIVINATSMVQTSRLYKLMQVRTVAAANALAIIASALVAVWLAVSGYGAWSLVWQAVVLSAVKSGALWIATGWRPKKTMSLKAVRGFFKVGSGMLGAAFLNVLFGKIYSLVVGNRAGILPLGYYTQADKWSTMGVATLSAVMTQSFLPALSTYQDKPTEFAAATAKMNRFSSYVMLPCLVLAVLVATPLFHVCFGTKWDAAIILFQLLVIRGIFTSLSSVYNNYIIARGHTRLIMLTEVIRDVVAIIAIAITLPYIAVSTPESPTYGIAIMLWGQIAASTLTWIYTLVMAAKCSWRTWWEFVTDSLPYCATTFIAWIPAAALAQVLKNEMLLLVVQAATFIVVYIGINAALGSRIQRDALDWAFRRKKF